MTSCTTDGNGTYTCPITRPNNYSAWMVWNPSKTVSYPVPSGATQYRDLNGNTTGLSGGTVSVGSSPILIER
jgi:hypothetical protein